ncbi:MAG TPA: class III lanthionine synthetase LanKC [Candidatus Limnocylindrales bacterium]|nr:class III lanthionine synthetase LanKC [Candidatus Limnocylindrales bacterium]
MPSRANPLYRLLDPIYCESFEKYAPCQSEFYDSVHAGLPPEWEIRRHGIWYYCGSPGYALPLQGWKIHVSACHRDAPEVLKQVAQVLFRRNDVSFKFALDSSVLLLLNSKNWSRGGSGKFMTIYPANSQVFLEVIEELYQKTRGFSGPYILSDHRYRDSSTVYYRFGGMRLRQVLDVSGEKIPVLVGPDGIEVPDQRRAYPVTPPWAESPIPADQETKVETAGELKGGRYRIRQALSFSNAGGVYLAADTGTGRTVVIKEARPHVNEDHLGMNAVENLKKEHRLLGLVADTGIAPEPLDLFQEWEHWFLVEDYVEGVTLSAHSAANNVMLRTRPTERDRQKWSDTVRSLLRQLMHIVETLHRRNIVFSDLSPGNLMVSPDTMELKLIDFEGAYQPGIDRPGALYTPGFVSPRRLSGLPARFEDDFYSVGAVLLSYLFPITPLFHLKPEVRVEILGILQREAGLPQDLSNAILRLLDPDPTQRPEPESMVEVLKRDDGQPPGGPDSRPVHDYSAIVDGILDHVENAATFNRTDRLFPADPRLFTTNPLSLAFGAAGVGYAIHKIRGTCPGRVIDWILGQKPNAESYPAGLYVGLSGIAWGLLEAGAADEAEKLLRLTFNHKLLRRTADLFYGTAGWGMACLRFFLGTRKEIYLEKAVQAGKTILATAGSDPRGYCWPATDETRLGLAHGSSGIALFLLYLYQATDDRRFLEAGQRALDFDLNHAVETRDGGYSWPSQSGAASPLYPYWRFGSAGIGQAVLRYYAVVKEQRYLNIIEKIFVDNDRKHAVLPGKFMGLSGTGEFLLDCHTFLGGDRYLTSASKVAEGLMLFQVEHNGIGFPGDSLARLCCDYGTGSAGAGLFLHRLISGGKCDFMLDDLLPSVSQALCSDPERRAAVRGMEHRELAGLR